MYVTVMPFFTAMPEPTARAAHVHERAFGESTISADGILAVSSTGTSTGSSASPFFTNGTQQLGGQDSDGGDGSDSNTGSLTKTVLEWVFALAALLVIASLSTWRYSRIRRKRQALSSFVPRPRVCSYASQSSQTQNRRRRSLPRTTGLSRGVSGPTAGSTPPLAMSATLFYPPSLTTGRYPVLAEPLTAHLDGIRRGRRAAQGADIDAQGRRGDGENSDDKDELPAYESVGGPPKYVDMDVGGIPLRILPMHMDTTSSRGESRSSSDGLPDAQSQRRRSDVTERRSTTSSPPPGPPPSLSNSHSSNSNYVSPLPPSYPTNALRPSETSHASEPQLPLNLYPC
ncbi:hypothetical protein DFH11DRAFT_1590087 [Phellopilus nigrolimitatus]|nr:hypothetical protein DFH11DRAFT_1590087 [Phellopilus nigrolimitatus]